MIWFKPSTWGWVVARRKSKEMAALDELRRILGEEQAEFTLLTKTVGDIEALLGQGKFQDAERLVPALVTQMKKKKLLDSIELSDFNRFKGTILKDVRAQMNQLK